MLQEWECTDGGLHSEFVAKLDRSLAALAGAIARDFVAVASLNPMLYTPPNWYVYGADFVVDAKRRPWLTELNSCLGIDNYETDVVHPYDAAVRLMLTRRRRDLGNHSFHPRACIDGSVRGRLSVLPIDPPRERGGAR